MQKKISTPLRLKSEHPSRGELWKPKSLYPYWEIPKNKLLISRAKELRKAGNLPEVLFWQTLKDKNKLGFDIDRQIIIGNYIVDFFIPELGLVFEIDGSSHDFKYKEDMRRDEHLHNKYGINTLRFKDLEVKKGMNNVLRSIEIWITENVITKELSEK